MVNIEIANIQYNGVPSIEVPLQGGGTASFLDTSDGNVTANDVNVGKICYSQGQRIVGTNSGSGSSFDNITQDGNKIVIPNGYIEVLIQQTNLNLVDKILNLS